MFGAVVVGIGTAGWVRIRDMLAPLPGSPAEKLTVRGFISRRNLDTLEVSQISVEEAVSREDIHVAFICTENVLHEDNISPRILKPTEHERLSSRQQTDRVREQLLNIVEHLAAKEPDVSLSSWKRPKTKHRADRENIELTFIRTFLQAGKHVCVEYPMTMSYKAAVELWDFAQEKGVILHEEHIELLTEDYKELKREVEGKILQEGTLHFTGGALKPGFGFPAFSGIARLTWLVELFGKLSVTAATIEEDSGNNYSKMTAKLLTSDNRPLTWIEERGLGLPRAKKINFQFDSCTLTQIPPAPTGAVGLFMQDLIHFSAKLAGQVSPEELQREKIRILHCLKLAERIQELCQS